MELESEMSDTNLGVIQKKKGIESLERRLANLKSYLGSGNKEREEAYWQEIVKTRQRLDELNSQTIPRQIIPQAN